MSFEGVLLCHPVVFLTAGCVVVVASTITNLQDAKGILVCVFLTGCVVVVASQRSEGSCYEYKLHPVVFLTEWELASV
jgi:hypothetical protein